MPTSKTSAGILVYRKEEDVLQFLLVHPGGPFWKNKDLGVWSIPKGEIHDGEDLLITAKREFEEETTFKLDGIFTPLGSITQKSGKIVHAWATKADLDVTEIKSNTCRVEWPPRSGDLIEIPEIDRGEYFDIETAKQKINPAQTPFLDKVELIISK